MSSSSRIPGTRITRRSFPDRVTAQRAGLSSRLARREPDLPAVRGPKLGAPENSVQPADRVFLDLPSRSTTPTEGVPPDSLPKGDGAAVGRKAGTRKYVPGGEHLPDGKFQASLVVDEVCHDQVLSVSRPVGARIMYDMIQNLPRGPSRHGHSRQDSVDVLVVFSF